MAKVQAWGREKMKTELAKRLKHAKKYRERLEPQWKINETTVYNFNSRRPYTALLSEDGLLGSDIDTSVDQTDMAVNYAWKFLRFIHSQMSANPPSVQARPTSTDGEDRNKADAADRVVRHAYNKEDIPEVTDQANLKCLTYGTGWIKVAWDPDHGETLEFDDVSGELTMTGAHRVYSPSTWDVWIDPDAKIWRDVRYIFERIEMPIDEAKFKWPKYGDEIDKFIKKKKNSESELSWDDDGAEIVEVFYYVEKGLPINGMAGRMVYCLEDGCILDEPTKNENPGETLGFAIITDIDVPDQVYGKSFIEYIYKLQDLLNRLDSSFVDNVAAHNVVRLVLPEGAELEDESLSNSAWDYTKITGNSGVGPYFAPPAQLMPDGHRLRENLIQGIQELAGVNDALQGKTSREVSGFSLQTMIDAGNQTRRRLFNKYTIMVRDTFKMYLGLACKYWTEPRTILVLGKEKAFEAVDLKGADIEGGYDVVCEYGASLSLDPAHRREEIMQLMPIFEKAGVPTKTILGMLKLNELESMYDRMTLAAERQKEIFSEMQATSEPIEPREMEDHAGMLDYAYYWVMTAEYKYLKPDMKELIDNHIKAREQLAAQAATKGQAAQPGAAPAQATPDAVPQLPAAAPAAAPMAPAQAPAVA